MTSLLTPLTSIRSLVPPIIVCGMSPHVTILQFSLKLCKWFLPSSTYERLNNLMNENFTSTICYFYETYSGTKVIFYGDKIPMNVCENVLYISNHQTTVDWMMAVSIAIRQGYGGKVRWFMKDSLKYLPFYGTMNKINGSIFVRRDGSNNNETLKRDLKRLGDVRKLGFYLVNFAEGTRYNPNKSNVIKKSQNIAEDKGYEPLQNVLFPRSKGLLLSLESMKTLDAIYDVTLAFKLPWETANRSQEGPGSVEMVSIYGREVHINFKRIPVSQLPKDEKELKDWLYSRYSEKDRLLSHFYDKKTNGTFPEESYEIPLKYNQTLPFVCFNITMLTAAWGTERGRDIYIKSCLFCFALTLATPILGPLLRY